MQNYTFPAFILVIGLLSRETQWQKKKMIYLLVLLCLVHTAASDQIYIIRGGRWAGRTFWSSLAGAVWHNEVEQMPKNFQWLAWCDAGKRSGDRKKAFEMRSHSLSLKLSGLCSNNSENMRDERAVNDTRIEMTDRLTHQTSMSHSLPRRKAASPWQLRDKLILADNRTVSSLMISKCYLE